MENLTAKQLEKMASDIDFVTAVLESMIILEPERDERKDASPLLREAMARTISLSNQLKGLPKAEVPA